MRRIPVAVAVALAVAVLVTVAGCGGTKTTIVTVGAKLGPGAPSEIAEFGYLKSLTKRNGRYELRFDPAWLLTGETAKQAKLEDTGSTDVPNDYYVVNEGRRLLTYLVAPDAKVTVLRSGVTATPVTVAQLALLVAGRNPFHMFEPVTTGFWILADGDTIRSLDQQYFP